MSCRAVALVAASTVSMLVTIMNVSVVLRTGVTWKSSTATLIGVVVVIIIVSSTMFVSQEHDPCVTDLRYLPLQVDERKTLETVFQRVLDKSGGSSVDNEILEETFQLLSTATSHEDMQTTFLTVIAPLWARVHDREALKGRLRQEMGSVDPGRRRIASFLYENVIVAEQLDEWKDAVLTSPNAVEAWEQLETQLDAAVLCQVEVRIRHAAHEYPVLKTRYPALFRLLDEKRYNDSRVERTIRILVSVQALAVLLLVLLQVVVKGRRARPVIMILSCVLQAALFAASSFLVRS